MRALEKRPVGQDHIESLLLGISKSMRLSGEREVRSSLIGQFVMESLRSYDAGKHCLPRAISTAISHL